MPDTFLSLFALAPKIGQTFGATATKLQKRNLYTINVKGTIFCEAGAVATLVNLPKNPLQTKQNSLQLRVIWFLDFRSVAPIVTSIHKSMDIER